MRDDIKICDYSLTGEIPVLCLITQRHTLGPLVAPFSGGKTHDIRPFAFHLRAVHINLTETVSTEGPTPVSWNMI